MRVKPCGLIDSLVRMLTFSRFTFRPSCWVVETAGHKTSTGSVFTSDTWPVLLCLYLVNWLVSFFLYRMILEELFQLAPHCIYQLKTALCADVRMVLLLSFLPPEQLLFSYYSFQAQVPYIFIEHLLDQCTRPFDLSTISASEFQASCIPRTLTLSLLTLRQMRGKLVITRVWSLLVV